MTSPPQPTSIEENAQVITLPTPVYESQTSVEQALHGRRSVRQYGPDPLSLAEISQLLWAAQGVTNLEGKRTAPSAGALYPLELFLVAGNVIDLTAGVYRFQPGAHVLALVRTGDMREQLARAALGQNPVNEAPAVIVIAAVYERTTSKYGERGIRYVHMEVGHTAQNIYLQVESLNLATVFIGAFEEEAVGQVLMLDVGEVPLGLMPVGKVD